ncbi:hypothetical protein HDU93_005454, partial [Gonapodya sp. JEL0774]
MSQAEELARKIKKMEEEMDSAIQSGLREALELSDGDVDKAGSVTVESPVEQIETSTGVVVAPPVLESTEIGGRNSESIVTDVEGLGGEPESALARDERESASYPNNSDGSLPNHSDDRAPDLEDLAPPSPQLETSNPISTDQVRAESENALTEERSLASSEECELETKGLEHEHIGETAVLIGDGSAGGTENAVTEEPPLASSEGGNLQAKDPENGQIGEAATVIDEGSASKEVTPAQAPIHRNITNAAEPLPSDQALSNMTGPTPVSPEYATPPEPSSPSEPSLVLVEPVDDRLATLVTAPSPTRLLDRSVPARDIPDEDLWVMGLAPEDRGASSPPADAETGEGSRPSSIFEQPQVDEPEP